MEPQSPNTSSEGLQPSPTTSAELVQLGEAANQNTPESSPAPQETDKASRETVNQNAGMSLPAVVVPTNDNTQVAAASQPATATPIDPANPAIADDVDVVEKEWVDRARQIVEQTRDDPYRQEEEVGKLQLDYRQKRYGRDIKASNDA